MEEITEIDMNKYYIFKREDVNKLSEVNRSFFRTIKSQIDYDRATKGKKDNHYLVLNMDDEIAELYLEDAIGKIHKAHFEDSRDNHHPFKKVYVKDIAVALINAILKEKRG